MSLKDKPKVVHMVTTASSIGLMRGQLSYLVEKGFNVTVLSSRGKRLKEAVKKDKVNIKAINMERTISPLKDLISLIKIILYFFKIKPHICNSGTPKAGLLGMIAARLTRVPYKVYTVRGLPFEGSSGLKRKILILTEKIACACADKVICISPSIREIIIDLKISSNEKTVVFGIGSSNGLRLENYNFNENIANQVKKIRKKHRLNDYNFVVGYVGRINNFKGVLELVNAFENLRNKYNIVLLLIGKKEEKDSISKKTNNKILNNPHIIEIGRVANPVPYYYAMDVLAFPTYREGFGNVSIEAQATGTPVITTNATGAVDTVVHNETGFITNIKDELALEKYIEKYILHPELIKKMGNRARERVINNFDSQDIWKSIEDLYRDGLKKYKHIN